MQLGCDRTDNGKYPFETLVQFDEEAGKADPGRGNESMTVCGNVPGKAIISSFITAPDVGRRGKETFLTMNSERFASKADCKRRRQGLLYASHRSSAQ